MLGSFNNWNTLKLSHKAKPSEDIDKIHQVVLDGIIDNEVNMVSLIQHIQPKWATMWLNLCQNPIYYTKNQCTMDKYVLLVKYLSNLNTWTVYKTKQSVIVKRGWKQNNIIFPTRTIVHPCLDVTTVSEVGKNQRVFAIKIKHARLYKVVLYV